MRAMLKKVSRETVMLSEPALAEGCNFSTTSLFIKNVLLMCFKKILERKMIILSISHSSH